MPTFTGSWDANAQDVAYTMTLKQTANSVSGSYEGADGSVGKITGKVKGSVLRFAWTQTDGSAARANSRSPKMANPLPAATPSAATPTRRTAVGAGHVIRSAFDGFARSAAVRAIPLPA